MKTPYLLMGVMLLVFVDISRCANLVKQESYYDFARSTPGSVALFQGNVQTKVDAQNAGYFTPIERGGRLTLSGGKDYWFIVNHHSDDDGIGFLRVKLITFFPIGTSIARFVYLTREGAWIRPTESTSLTPQDFKDYASCSISDFTKDHADQTYNALDGLLGAKWHGTPQGANQVSATEGSSWSDRESWHNLFPELLDTWTNFAGRFSVAVTPDTPFIMNGMLIRFEEAPRTKLSERPLLFDTKSPNAIACYISIASSVSPSYQGQYYITFKQPQ